MLYKSVAGFVAILKSCRVMLSCVHSGFVVFKKIELLIQEWNTSLLRVKDLQVFELEFLDYNLRSFFNHFLPAFSFLFVNLVFNSVPYSKLVGEMRDVCHCQAKKNLDFHQKIVLSQTFFCFAKKNLLPTQFWLSCFTWDFLPVFNITL